MWREVGYYRTHLLLLLFFQLRGYDIGSQTMAARLAGGLGPRPNNFATTRNLNCGIITLVVSNMRDSGPIDETLYMSILGPCNTLNQDRYIGHMAITHLVV